jgi:hypothetical protein
VFFTKFGYVIAIIALIFGVLQIAMGIHAINMPAQLNEAGIPMLGNKTSGQTIDSGIYKMLFAVALGILAEISRSVRKKDKAED